MIKELNFGRPCNKIMIILEPSITSEKYTYMDHYMRLIILSFDNL